MKSGRCIATIMESRIKTWRMGFQFAKPDRRNELATSNNIYKGTFFWLLTSTSRSSQFETSGPWISSMNVGAPKAWTLTFKSGCPSSFSCNVCRCLWNPSSMFYMFCWTDGKNSKPRSVLNDEIGRIYSEILTYSVVILNFLPFLPQNVQLSTLSLRARSESSGS